MSKKVKLTPALKQCRQILDQIMRKKEVEAFLEPVPWKELGLYEYPQIIKDPMDLGTIKTKLSNGEYGDENEFRADMDLVWDNCMRFNSDDSELYAVAAKMKRQFHDKFSKVQTGGGETSNGSGGGAVKPVTLDDKKAFSQMVYRINSVQLGEIVQILDKKCSSSIRKIDTEDIEVDVDAIDAKTFWVLYDYADGCLKEAKSKSGAKRPAKTDKKDSKKRQKVP